MPRSPGLSCEAHQAPSQPFRKSRRRRGGKKRGEWPRDWAGASFRRPPLSMKKAAINLVGYRAPGPANAVAPQEDGCGPGELIDANSGGRWMIPSPRLHAAMIATEMGSASSGQALEISWASPPFRPTLSIRASRSPHCRVCRSPQWDCHLREPGRESRDVPHRDPPVGP